MAPRLTVFRLACVVIIVSGCAGPIASESPGPVSNVPTFTRAPTDPTATPTIEPTVVPTDEPEPTIEGALPLRKQIETNPTVVDRAGVPSELGGRYWWTFNGDAGQVGTTAQLGLPAGERILTVSDGFVVAATGAFGEPEDLIIRAFSDGAIVREIPSGVSEVSAVLVAGRLFWTGYKPGVTDDAAAADGGVWTARVDPADVPRTIVPPGEIIGTYLSGRRIELSPTGRTIAAITTGGTEWADVIDVATLKVRVRVHDSPDAITDDTYLAWDSPSTDAPFFGFGITAYDVATGGVRWRFPDRADVDRFVPNGIRSIGTAFIVHYEWKVGDQVDWVVARFDSKSGKRSQIFRAADADIGVGPYVQTSISSPQHYVMTRGFWLGQAVSTGPTSANVLDVATWELHEDAFVIDAAFMCYADYCLRN